MNLVLLVLAGIFVNNYVLSQFLGICPFLGVSRKIETAVGMGVAVIFVMSLAAAAAWLVYALILVPLNITYLYNIAFILVIASLVQFVEMFLKKAAPALYQALGVFLPLITTNCAVLGVAVLNMQKNYNFIESVLNGFGGATGFALAIVLFAGIRERIADNDTPKAFDGFPLALLTAGLMSIAFLGFSGLIKL
ncbi:MULTISPECIES: electron transport complex subunit RsxA [Anaerotignum]|jgi:electron transport complex protein RnfA|uniref:Ion-translocating oxidoreductase complex subunit A n=2 Tax=Anaerotignum propionicum TaxID=28446 RepID=A0A120MK05_ANAPI|nr:MULTISPECIES: electron transport complex subunit RsxA [Anaerotignum]AMJ39731.1 electron transport complex subunit RsxA [Anaerotignum propionicum DSM 1682]MEA5056503.1 electron transport complex subunit RsxA [Anaerotignum propionicum]SHE29414.1 electron transport complex protein RnfA [[Clostridium] propionicum DSM 1682] [Anaerotignum propionicum DSM 1682]